MAGSERLSPVMAAQLMAVQSQALALAAQIDALLMGHGCPHTRRAETTTGGADERTFLCLEKECGVEWSEPFVEEKPATFAAAESSGAGDGAGGGGG